MAYLVLENIAKSFRRDRVLEDLSLSLERGETVAVFGPSGCGKSVLLRIIAGVLAPDAGNLRIGERSVTHLPPEQRNVGMAFQTFALYPHLSAFDNIASPLRARNATATEIQQRVGTIAELLRINHVLSHLPAQLSNGQKQRTSLARALVSGPDLLLLDDPLRNVDAKLRYEMRLELPRVLREFESTVLYVTQDYKEAMAIGNRIGVLYDGCFQQVDTPRHIYRQPSSIQVARLFGDPTINLLPTQRLSGNERETVVTVGGESLNPPLAVDIKDGQDLLLGIRPEDIEVYFEPIDDGLPLALEAVTPLNLRNVLLLRTREGTEILASAAESRNFARDRSQVWGRINWSRAVWFDAASGRVIST